MVSHLRRAAIPPRNAPHDWNSWDNYRTVHDRRLSEHPFVASFLDTLVDTLVFESPESEDHLRLGGFIRCQGRVRLEVTKEFAVSYDNRGRMFVRCYRYRYIGRVSGGPLLLKYHNLHRNNPDEYVHRIYDPATGRELFHEVLRRYQFPTFPEVLDELEFLAGGL